MISFVLRVNKDGGIIMFKKLLLSGIVCTGLLGAGWNVQAHHVKCENECNDLSQTNIECVQECNTNVECIGECNDLSQTNVECVQECNTNVECIGECNDLAQTNVECVQECNTNVECIGECNDLAQTNVECAQECNTLCNMNTKGHSHGCGHHHSRCR